MNVGEWEWQLAIMTTTVDRICSLVTLAFASLSQQRRWHLYGCGRKSLASPQGLEHWRDLG